MLEIIVSGQPLDLPSDIQINLTIENPFVTADRIPMPYSLAFDLPTTAKNLKAFNYPNRYGVEFSQVDYDCIIRFQGLNLTAGILTLGQSEKTIKVNFRGAEITDNLSKKLYDIELQEYLLGRIDFPPVDINFNNGPGLTYKNLMQSAITSNNGRFALAPVRVAGEDWQQGILRRKNIGYPDSSADSMYINFYNARTKNWMLSDSQATIHTSNYPYPFVHYLVEQIFGETLDHNPFTENDFANLVLITTYHPEWRNKGKYPIGGPKYGLQDDTREGISVFEWYYIYLEQRLPDLDSKTFVRELVKLFGFTLAVIQGKFYLKTNASILAKSVNKDWSKKMVGRPSFLLEKRKTFNYGYEGDTQTKMEVPPYSQVPTYENLANYNFRPEADDGDSITLMVTQTGEVWDLIKDGPSKTYEKRTSGFGEKTSGENNFDLKVNLKPLEMTFDKYWWVRKLELDVEKPEMKDWFVPVFEGDRAKRSTKASLMFYHGIKPAYHSGDSYPYLSPHNIDPKGNELGNISLYWEGERGLVNKFHKQYQAWIEKDRLKLSAVLLLNSLDLHQLDITDKVHINGRNFFIEKIQVTIRHNRIDPAVVDFIEA